jgi:hypothetical protein
MAILSAASASATGATAWTGAVRVEDAGGLLHAYASPNEQESAETIAAQGRAFPVPSASLQIALGDGLSPGGTYWAHYLYTAGDGTARQATSPPFTTPALGPASGTVTLEILKRSAQGVAPDAVFFSAEIATAEIIPPPDRRAYDESFHKPLYVWDFGDPGAASDKVVNLPAVHNDLNRAYGKEVAHVFTRPGLFTVTCTVYDPGGRLVGSVARTVEVADPEQRFAGDATILLDPDGRGDPEAYPGAQVVTTWSAAWEALHGLGGPGRLLLPRGRTLQFADRFTIDWRYTNVYLGGWGAGERPVLECTGDHLFYAHHSTTGDIVFLGIAFRGPWDSSTETGQHAIGFSTEQEGDRSILFDDCTFSGFGMTLQMIDEWDATFTTMMALHNCDITNWGDYGIYVGRNVAQFTAFLGTAIHQASDAMMGGGARKQGDTNQHGPIRLSNGGRTYVVACDLFSRNGWSLAGNLAADQPCFRWSTSPREQTEIRCSCVIERTAMEGGFEIVALRDAIRDEPYFGTNFVMDKCLLVGTARTFSGVGVQFTGTTIRNTIMVRPNTPMISDRWYGWVRSETPRSPNLQDPDDPVEIYANTMVNLMDDTNRDGSDLILEDEIDLFAVHSFENNVGLAPNARGQQAEPGGLVLAPMPTVGGVWTSRYLGPKYRNLRDSGAQLTLDARFATPPGSVGMYIPETGSQMIDDASGRVAVDDFFGRWRGLDPDRGAVEL